MAIQLLSVQTYRCRHPVADGGAAEAVAKRGAGRQVGQRGVFGVHADRCRVKGFAGDLLHELGAYSVGHHFEFDASKFAFCLDEAPLLAHHEKRRDHQGSQSKHSFRHGSRPGGLGCIFIRVR